MVVFKEIADRGTDPGEGSDADKRETMISDFCEKNPESSYKDAVIAVSGKHPELFKDR